MGGLLDNVDASQSELDRALEISRRTVAVGFEWESLADIWDKVAEEQTELCEAYSLAPHNLDGTVDEADAQKRHAVELEFGDLLFALVNIARRMGVDPEQCLQASNDKFISRWQHMEAELDQQSRTLDGLSTDELLCLWQHAKAAERL